MNSSESFGPNLIGVGGSFEWKGSRLEIRLQKAGLAFRNPWSGPGFELEFPGLGGQNTALPKFGAVAQLVRVPDCRSGGCGFESRLRRSESLGFYRGSLRLGRNVALARLARLARLAIGPKMVPRDDFTPNCSQSSSASNRRNTALSFHLRMPC